MIWFAKLAVLWHRITSYRANDAGNEQDYICELVNSTRRGKWDISLVRLKIGLIEVDNIRYKLTHAEKELQILQQDIRIYEQLKAKRP